jgi:hypothetical protein
MTTGNFVDFTGNIADLGPIYPFVGWEGFFCIVGLAVWIIWHIVQIRMENKELREHAEAHGDRDSLTEIMGRESLIIEKQARREAV